MTVRSYMNGNTRVTIDLNNGTKTRFTKDDEFKPAFAESMDVNITHRCDGLCEFCYDGASPDREHASLLTKYMREEFIPSLHPYTEMALNGNDLSHPELPEFLRLLRNQKVIANLTVNQRHFLQKSQVLKQWMYSDLIHGLGVSLTDSNDPELVRTIKRFPNQGENIIIHTIAGLLMAKDIQNLENQDLKVLVLGYKYRNRGMKYYDKHESSIKMNQAILENLLPSMIKRHCFSVISFDNLALSQLHVRKILSEEEWNHFYMGEDGTFTFYIDLVDKTFAKDSLTIADHNHDIRDYRTVDNMFREIQREREYQSSEVMYSY